MKQNVFTKDVNKILLSVSYDKRIQSIISIETYVYRTNKEIIHKNEKLNFSFMKQHKKLLFMMMLQKKTSDGIIQTSLKLLIIDTEFL